MTPLVDGVDQGLLLIGVWQANVRESAVVDRTVPDEFAESETSNTFLRSNRSQGAARRRAVMATRLGDMVVVVNAENKQAWPEAEDRGPAVVRTVLAVLPADSSEDTDYALVYRVERDQLDGREVREALGHKSRRISTERILALP